MKKITNINNHTELEEILTKYNIDPTEYGKNKAKTLDHLLKEILDFETILYDLEGKLVRVLTLSTAKVYYKQEGSDAVLELREDKQVFKDGRMRVRNLDPSISEKFKMGENEKDCILRALVEELGMHLDSPYEIEYLRMDKEENLSPSYPGLLSIYHLHRFNITIPEIEYNKEGYMEKQKDKTTYFSWKKINI